MIAYLKPTKCKCGNIDIKVVFVDFIIFLLNLNWRFIVTMQNFMKIQFVYKKQCHRKIRLHLDFVPDWSSNIKPLKWEKFEMSLKILKSIKKFLKILISCNIDVEVQFWERVFSCFYSKDHIYFENHKCTYI